ncbi:hypothetical protein L7F22_031715, partial [Adiantum nelumboides]|nr:hypothetical protein [Adiantum nelumboides]
AFKKHLGGTLVEEHRPQIHATTSSSCMVCSTLAQRGNTSQEVLLDLCSSISSISKQLVQELGLHTSKAPSIKVLFGNNQK